MTLDRKVDITPTQLSSEEVRMYRELLIKYISELGTDCGDSAQADELE